MIWGLPGDWLVDNHSNMYVSRYICCFSHLEWTFTLKEKDNIHIKYLKLFLVLCLSKCNGLPFTVHADVVVWATCLSTCSSAEDLHHWRGEEAHPVRPPLGVMDVTFPATVWVLLQDLTPTNHSHASVEMPVSLQTALALQRFTITLSLVYETWTIANKWFSHVKTGRFD